MSGNHRKRNEEDVNELPIDVNNIDINDELVGDGKINDEEINEQNDDYEYVFNDYEEDDEDSGEDVSRDDSILQSAIIKGRPMKNILYLIEVLPMELQHKNKLGDYPLHIACMTGNCDLAMELIDLYPEATRHKNSKGLYPLHLACHFHQPEFLVMKLIEIFPEAVSESTTYGTALHFACRHLQSPDVVTKLIEINPLAIQEKNPKDGRYPIHYAISQDQPIELMKLFLDNDPLGIQRRDEGRYGDNYGGRYGAGATPLHLACKYNIDLVEYLMQNSDLQINVRDRYGKTPLHYACYNNQNEIVDMLLCHPDVDVNARDSLNDTPLHKTLKKDEGLFFLDGIGDLIQKLLNYPFILINEKNNNNKRPLDLIKDRVNELEKETNPFLFERYEKQLSYHMKIVNILEEFTVKQRWRGYCYHFKSFITDDRKNEPTRRKD